MTRREGNRENGAMIDIALFRFIASQVMTASAVDVRGRRLRVRQTSLHHLRSVIFTWNGRKYMAIEQNPEKASYWAKLARQGHQVVQFKDIKTNRFIAVAVDGQVREYRNMARREAS